MASRIKTPPITREQFLHYAQPIQASVGGLTYKLMPDETINGTLKWGFSTIGPWSLALPDRLTVPCSVSFSITILGSNRLPP